MFNNFKLNLNNKHNFFEYGTKKYFLLKQQELFY